MENLFPSMLLTLSDASEKIEDTLAKSFLGNPNRLTETQKDEWVDSMSLLHGLLIELNNYLHIEYDFDQALTGDIENYSTRLQEYQPQLEELTGFLLDRPRAFPGDPFAKDQARYLEEIMQQIIHHSKIISQVLTQA